jgi:uncharacterized protein (TIGR03435 family)
MIAAMIAAAYMPLGFFSIFWAVFWKSGAGLGAALCVNRLLWRKSADLRRLVLSTTIATLLMAAAAFPVMPRWTAMVPLWLSFQQPSHASVSYQPADQAPLAEEPEPAMPAVGRTPAEASARHIDFTPWIVPLIWSLGAAILLSRFAINLRGLRRLRAASEPVTDAQVLREAARYGRGVQLWQNDTIAAPVTWGIFRPVILVPAGFEGLTAECRDAVLCHEAAHIQSGDFLMRTLAEIARAAIWFQPLMWIVRRRLHEEQELACDNRVLASGGKPSTYAKLLLDWDARPGMDFLIAVGIANRSCLKRRLYALLDPGLRRDTVAKAGVACAWLLGLAAALPLAAVSVTQDAPPRPATVRANRLDTTHLDTTHADTAAPVQIAQAAPSSPPPARRPAPAPAPAPAPKFDAASIKPCQPGDGPGRSGKGDMGKSGGVDPNMPEGVGGYFRASPGRLDITCGSILTMVDFAYVGQGGKPLLNNPGGPMREAESINGVPKWAMAPRYTIHAETDDPVANGPTQGEGGRTPAAALLYGPMLQGLLEERFQLKLHRVVEEAPMYALTVAKGGFKLKPMKDGDCTEPLHVAGGGTIMNRGPIGPDDEPYCHWFGWPSHGPNRTLIGGGATIDRLAAELGELVLDRKVFDRTGISGVYNFRLEYAPDENTPCTGLAQMCAVDPNSDIPAGANIFTAIEQQLGLKLEQVKGPKEHIVVDHVEPPSEN